MTMNMEQLWTQSETEEKELDFLLLENGTVVKGRLESGDIRVFTLGRDRKWHCGAWSMSQTTFRERVTAEEVLA